MAQTSVVEREKQESSVKHQLPPTTVLRLLTNAYEPDPRVRQEALLWMTAG